MFLLQLIASLTTAGTRISSFVHSAAGTAALLFVVALPALAQTPTTEQLELFRNLSPSQQQALMDQATSSSSTRGETTSPRNRSRDESATADRADEDRRLRRQRDTEDEDPLFPVLKAEDTVLVQVTLP